MEPTTAILLLSLLAGAGVTGYLAVAPHDRTYRATRGSLGAVAEGWSSGRGTASSAFSRPPAPSSTGSSFGRDLSWLGRQLWGGVRVGSSFVRGVVRGYRPRADAAMVRRADRRAARVQRAASRTGTRVGRVINWTRRQGRRVNDWMVAQAAGVRTAVAVATGTAVPVTPGAQAATPTPDNIRGGRMRRLFNALPTGGPLGALGQYVRERLMQMYLDDEVQNNRPVTQTSSTDTAGGNTVSTDIVNVPDLAIVTEFDSPGAMEESLDELGELAAQIAQLQAALVEGLHDFVNAYAEAKFATANLTQTVAGLLESIDDGQVNVPTFAELIPPVKEAVEEARALGEGASQIDAEGDVGAFKES